MSYPIEEPLRRDSLCSRAGGGPCLFLSIPTRTGCCPISMGSEPRRMKDVLIVRCDSEV